MGRVPCCDKVGVKKGPWTPEEDILLVSYVQQHGPGNWTSVPIHTGLKRCSKSCRLRWTNYLRPGIKRGTFSHQEDKMIIQLQALFGNKWAAIASYLPERTDNDIKNHWNTHLKKRLTGSGIRAGSGSMQWERRLQADIKLARQALHDALSICGGGPDNDKLLQTTPYASNAENIARLLKNWTKDDRQQKKLSNRDDDHNSAAAVIEVDDKGVFGFMDSATDGSDTFDLEDWFILDDQGMIIQDD